jgi:enterochelin esterase family protein
VERFWTEVEAVGTPLVEAVPGADGAQVAVTFPWRAREPVGNVVVCGEFADMRAFADNRLAWLPGTDVWHVTLRLPAATRVPYRLSPADPLTPVEPADPATRRWRRSPPEQSAA